MKLLVVISSFLLFPGPGATDPKSDVTALQKPISVLSKPVSAIKGDPRVTSTIPPPTNNVWLHIQPALDRSLGYIPDNLTYELDWLDRQRAEQWGLVEPLRPFDLFEMDQDRQLRIEQANKSAGEIERARRRELDRRQYLLYVYRDTNFAVAAQAQADERELQQVEQNRSAAISKATDEYNRAMRAVAGTPAQRAAARQRIESEYQSRREEIRRGYDDARGRILGY